MKYALSLIAVAGIAAGANAATSQLTWQVSVNGGAFGSSASANPGDTVTFRLRVALTGNSGAGSIGGSGGLAGFNFLPTLSNVSGTDTIIPLGTEQFPEGSTGNPFPGVINDPDAGGPITNVYTGPVPAPAGTFRGPGNTTGNGRNAPWGSNGTNTNGVATSSVIAGVLTWRAGVISNTGVSLSQLNQNNSAVAGITAYDNGGTPGDNSDDQLVISDLGSFYNNVRNGVNVFQYSIVAGGGGSENRVLVQSSSVLTPVQWFTNAQGASSSTALPAVTDATLTIIVPAPGALALLGLGGIVAGRRRR